MSITDELRRFANGSDWIGCTASVTARKMLDVADRIDAEHEKRIASVMNDALYHANEKDMADLGWIRLPRDADNEIVKVGDKLDGYNKTIEVMWLRLGRTGWWIIDEYGKSYACCDAFLHHREPTVEDVLDEFASAYDRIGGEDEEHQKYLDLIAEYAAKLQLRGDGE